MAGWKTMTNKQDKAFDILLHLIISILWCKKFECSYSSITDDDWAEVLSLAIKQTVAGIAFNALDKVPKDMQPSKQVLLKWSVLATRVTMQNKKMNDTLCDLFSVLQSKNFQPILQKGQGIAQKYPLPELRECGDIDLYFRSEDERESAEKYLAQFHGCNITKMPDGSSHYKWKGIDVEHHAQLVDLHYSKAQKYAHQLVEAKGFDGTGLVVGDVTIMCPQVEVNLLLLNTHILKHAIGVGIGLRQLCDIAMAYKEYTSHIGPDNDIKEIYTNAGIKKWSALLHSFLVTYLGMPEEYLPYKEDLSSQSPSELLEIVRRGGNFGHYRNTRNKQNESVWRRKINTALSFVQNVRFALKYAPRESFSIMKKLVIGQMS